VKFCAPPQIKIDAIQPHGLKLYDEAMNQHASRNEEVCRIVGSIRHLCFLDTYGVQWEFQQVHTDIGDE